MAYVCFQAQKRFDVVVQPEKSPVPTRRVLLEKEKGRQDDPRGPYEVESSRNRGQCLRIRVVADAIFV